MMTETDRRTWRYRKQGEGVEGVIFNSPEDVPEGEGWCRSPTGEPGPLDGVVEAVSEPEADAETEDAGDEEDEKDRIKRLRAELKQQGVKLPPRTNLEWLNNKIAELENADA